MLSPKIMICHDNFGVPLLFSTTKSLGHIGVPMSRILFPMGPIHVSVACKLNPCKSKLIHDQLYSQAKSTRQDSTSNLSIILNK